MNQSYSHRGGGSQEHGSTDDTRAHTAQSTGWGTKLRRHLPASTREKGHTHVSTQGGKDHTKQRKTKSGRDEPRNTVPRTTKSLFHVAVMRCELGGFSKCDAMSSP